MSNNMSIYDATKAGAMMVGTAGVVAVCYKTCLALGALQESLDELNKMAKNITDEDIKNVCGIIETTNKNLGPETINHLKFIIKEIAEGRGRKLIFSI